MNISPDEVHALPLAVRHDFLLAFVDALKKPVFLVGAAVTALAFALSWLLKEVPLCATAYADSADLGAEGAVAGATAVEGVVALPVRPRAVLGSVRGWRSCRVRRPARDALR